MSVARETRITVSARRGQRPLLVCGGVARGFSSEARRCEWWRVRRAGNVAAGAARGTSPTASIQRYSAWILPVTGRSMNLARTSWSILHSSAIETEARCCTRICSAGVGRTRPETSEEATTSMIARECGMCRRRCADLEQNLATWKKEQRIQNQKVSLTDIRTHRF
jgi:hypothetical protein